jgi:hypothetical protein
MQWRPSSVILYLRIGTVFKKDTNDFNTSTLRCPMQWSSVLVITGFDVCTIFEEDASNFQIAISRCPK